MDRYKFQNSKFTSADNGRKLRVMQKKLEQRTSRNMSNAENKIMDKPGPMEKLQYQKLLLWKEQRQIKKDSERHSKRPVFHTGVYHPDQVKFLHTQESEVDAGKSCNKTRRSVSKSKRKSAKVKSSTSAMNKPKISKSLQCSAGVSLPCKRANVTKMTLRPPPTSIGSGIDSPKVTPANQQQALASKTEASGQKITSFTPKNFSFNFVCPVSVEASNSKLEIKSEKVGLTLIHESVESHNVSKESSHSIHLMELSVAVIKLPTSGGKLTPKNKFAAPRDNLITTQSSVILEKYKKNEPNHSCEEAENMKMVETVEKNKNVDYNFQQNNTNCDVPVTISYNTDSSEPVELPEKIKHCKSRKSIPKILISPPTSKLRPRRPCRRSTKLSKYAYGNHESLGSCQSVSLDAKSSSKPGRKRRSSTKFCKAPNLGTEIHDENVNNIWQQQELFQIPLLKKSHLNPTVKLVKIDSNVAQNLSILSPIDINTLQVSVTRSPLTPHYHSATQLTKRRTKSCSPISKLDSSMCKQETPDSPVSLEILDDSVYWSVLETPAKLNDTPHAEVELMTAFQPSIKEPILTPGDDSNVILLPDLSPLESQKNVTKCKPNEDISFNTPTGGSSRVSFLPDLHSAAEKTDELRVENSLSHDVHGAEGILSHDFICSSPLISVKEKRVRRSSTASATPRRSTRLVQ